MFNASLLNKNIDYFFLKILNLTNPKVLTVAVCPETCSEFVKLSSRLYISNTV